MLNFIASFFGCILENKIADKTLENIMETIEREEEVPHDR